MLFQAEEVEILGCAECSEFVTCTCTVRPLKGPITYEHYGEIYKGLLCQ